MSTNESGTAWRARIASPSAVRSCSSSQPSSTWPASWSIDFEFARTEGDEGI